MENVDERCNERLETRRKRADGPRGGGQHLLDPRAAASPSFGRDRPPRDGSSTVVRADMETATDAAKGAGVSNRPISVAQASDGHRATLTHYYEWLWRWSQWTSRFRALSGVGAHDIHRALADPATGEVSTRAVNRLIEAEIADHAAPRVLDAGCGYGGVTLDLAGRSPGRWHGITISPRQVEVATRNARAMGLAERVRFTLASYDAPLAETYDRIFAVESLIHSADPAGSVATLAAALAPGGRFVIVDDMPVDALPRAAEADLARFRRCWHCPVVPSVSEWQRHLVAAGCRIERVVDLNDRQRPRSEAEIADALAEVTAKRRWRDRVGLAMVSDAQEGGLALERLGRQGHVRYTMITARRDRPDAATRQV
jgi:SAM-dependent methyltransferase